MSKRICTYGPSWSFVCIYISTCSKVCLPSCTFQRDFRRHGSTRWCTFQFFFASKLISFVLWEIFSFDNAGEMYKMGGDNDGNGASDNKMTFERSMATWKDLDKPVLFRTSQFWWQFTFYPFVLSSTLVACNIYSLGPFTGFGVFSAVSSGSHLVCRNGLFGTHPSYNEDADGEMYCHACNSVIPGLFSLYRIVFGNFTRDHVVPICVESENRRVAGDREALINSTTKSTKCVKDSWKPIVEGEAALFHEIVPNIPD
jgi:hypothetical protein